MVFVFKRSQSLVKLHGFGIIKARKHYPLHGFGFHKAAKLVSSVFFGLPCHKTILKKHGLALTMATKHSKIHGSDGLSQPENCYDC